MLAVGLGGFEQAVDHGAGGRTARRIGKQEVFTSHGNGLGDVLGADVGDRQSSILLFSTDLPCWKVPKF